MDPFVHQCEIFTISCMSAFNISNLQNPTQTFFFGKRGLLGVVETLEFPTNGVFFTRISFFSSIQSENVTSESCVNDYFPLKIKDLAAVSSTSYYHVTAFRNEGSANISL